VDAPVCLLDVAPTVCDAAGIEPMERMDGKSLLPYLKPDARQADRELVFQAGWLSTGNPACGTQRWEPGGRHHFYVHNLGSVSDELYDMTQPDAGNLSADPAHRQVLVEMIRRMYALLEEDPRWGNYRQAFRFQHYADVVRA